MFNNDLDIETERVGNPTAPYHGVFGGIEAYYFSLKSNHLKTRRGKPLGTTILPRYLTSSEAAYYGKRSWGSKELPTASYRTTSPFFQSKSRHFYGRSIINRGRLKYIAAQNKAVVQDEDGNFWFKGELDKFKELHGTDINVDTTSADTGYGSEQETPSVEDDKHDGALQQFRNFDRAHRMLLPQMHQHLQPRILKMSYMEALKLHTSASKVILRET